MPEVLTLNPGYLKRQCRRECSVAWKMLLVMGLVTAARAQEAVRLSMTSAAAAEARNRAAASMDYYNLKLGPTSWRFTSGLEADYNDNVTYVSTNPESDLIFRPQIGAQLLWPVSEKNSINLNLGAGYSAYVENPGLSRSFITPDSELSFNLYVGEFLVNLHDRFSITENTYQDPTVAGTGDYSQLQNALGTTVQWDLNKALLRLDYDHENYMQVSGAQHQPDGQSEVFSLSGGYAPRPTSLLGLQVGAALLHYTGATAVYPDATEWNVGPFYNARLTEHMQLQSSGGYVAYTPDSSQTAVGCFDGFYGQLALTHRISQHVGYSVNGSRTIRAQLQGGTVDLYSAGCQINWQIIRNTTLATSFLYYHGTDLYVGGEVFDQYGPQISFSRSLTSKLVSSLRYQFYLRDSNQVGRNYTVNIVSLSLAYRF